MNISSAIQQHYRKQSTLFISLDPDSIRHIFAKLATGDIVRGNLWNPFTSRYKFKLRWDGNTAHLDGPTGPKMIPLITEITIEPSIRRDVTTLNLVMNLSIRYINTSLILTLILAALTLCLPSQFLGKVVIVLFWVMMFYGLSWMYFFHSRSLILKCLPEELSTVDRYAR
jgi:hypothetical protein